MTCFAKVRASGQDRRLAHARPFREGATQHREPLRQSGIGHAPLYPACLESINSTYNAPKL